MGVRKEEAVYRLTYRFEAKPEGISREELEALGDDKLGACDAVFFASILHGDDGATSVLINSLDGRTQQELPAEGLFHVWAALARHLAHRDELPTSLRVIADSTFETIRHAILARRGS